MFNGIHALIVVLSFIQQQLLPVEREAKRLRVKEKKVMLVIIKHTPRLQTLN